MIPLTTVSERITKHIRVGSECGKGYSAVLIRLLILSTAQLLCQSGSSFIFSGHLLPSLRFTPGNFFCWPHSCCCKVASKVKSYWRPSDQHPPYDQREKWEHSKYTLFVQIKRDTWAHMQWQRKKGGRWWLQGQLIEAGINTARERQSCCFLDICK